MYELKSNGDLSSIFCTGIPRVIGLTEVPEDTERLEFVEASCDLAQIRNYHSATAVSINNVKFDRERRAGLVSVGRDLEKIEVLSIWNCKGFDPELLRLFRGLQYLQLSYASAQVQGWQGSWGLAKLKGLFLIDAHKVQDLEFCRAFKLRLKVLSLIGGRGLSSVAGIESQKAALSHLTLQRLSHDGRRPKGFALDVAKLASLKKLERVEVDGYECEPKVFQKLRLAGVEVSVS